MRRTGPLCKCAGGLIVGVVGDVGRADIGLLVNLFHQYVCWPPDYDFIMKIMCWNRRG